MKKLIFILPVLCLLMACSKEVTEPDGRAGGTVDTKAFLKFKNVQGQDLLDPTTANAITQQDIDVYTLKSNGQKVLYMQGNLDYPKGIRIMKASSNNGYYMLFMFQTDSSWDDVIGNKMTRFIRYKDGSEDKIVGEFKIGFGYFILKKLWINDVLKDSTGEESFFNPIEMIK